MDHRHLTITSRRPGFWRCGRQWPSEPVTVAAEDFDPAQLQALHDEPMLIVTPASSRDAEAAGAGEGTPSPADVATRAARILAAIAACPNDEAHRTRDGRPEVAALREATGLADLSAAERDVHVAAFQNHLTPLLAAPPPKGA